MFCLFFGPGLKKTSASISCLLESLPRTSTSAPGSSETLCEKSNYLGRLGLDAC